jgi:phytol kinase
VARDVLYAVGLCLGIAFALGVQARAVLRGLIPTAASRKLGHVALGTGLIASLFGYSDAPSVRWIAALPFAFALVSFSLVGTGLVAAPELLRAGTRQGDRREFLFGPALLVVGSALCLLTFWRSSPVGLGAVAVLVYGDGLAEFAGRRFPSPRIPWNRDKSFAGALSVFLCGAAGAVIVLGAFAAFGHVRTPLDELIGPVAVVSFVGALVESLPLGRWDNLVLPLTCAAVGVLVF